MKDYSEMAHKSQEELKEAVKENLESFKAEKQKEVFAEFDKMVAHLARTHALYQDEIARLLAAWFNAQPGCLRVNILPTELLEVKSGVGSKDHYIQFKDGTWIDLDPTMQLNPAFDIKEGNKVKVYILKED